MIEDITSIQYVDRLVAFVDILGWKRLVKDSENDANLLRNIAILSNAQNGMGDIAEHANGIRHIRMSDASVFVADPEDKIQVYTLIQSIISIHTTALLHGFLARGALVLGKIYCSKTTATILGPALTTAYENSENGVAFFPRTILDRESVKLIYRLYGGSDYDQFKKAFPRTNGFPIEKDSDDMNFVSYLGGFMQSAFGEHYRSAILRGLSENMDIPKNLQKYSWLKNHFNSAYPDFAIESN